MLRDWCYFFVQWKWLRNELCTFLYWKLRAGTSCHTICRAFLSFQQPQWGWLLSLPYMSDQHAVFSLVPFSMAVPHAFYTLMWCAHKLCPNHTRPLCLDIFLAGVSVPLIVKHPCSVCKYQQVATIALWMQKTKELALTSIAISTIQHGAIVEQFHLYAWDRIRNVGRRTVHVYKYTLKIID